MDGWLRPGAALRSECSALLLVVLSLCVDSIWSKSWINADGVTEYCETEEFKAECPDGQVIFLKNATYGRMKVGRCVNKNYGFVGCATGVLDSADRFCSGRQRCRVPIPNSSFNKNNPCPEDLKPYLELSYVCVKVETGEGQDCRRSGFVLPSSPSGYIANVVTLDTGKGAQDCPWIIQARQGQQINVTLIDFARSLPTDANQASDMYDICHVYAVLRERSGTGAEPETVCKDSVRSRMVFTSLGHSVELRIRNGRRMHDPEYFLLQYEIYGCADPILPANSWSERKGDILTVGCESSNQAWELRCTGHEWDGYLGNCSLLGEEKHASIGEIILGTNNLPFEVSMVIIIAIAIGIGIIVLSIGLICFYGFNKPVAKPPPLPPRRPERPVLPVPPRPSYDRQRTPTSRLPATSSQNSLPPPAPILMDRATILATESAYAYISEMPPPPLTPPSGSSDSGILPAPPASLLSKDGTTYPLTPEEIDELPFPDPPPNLDSMESLEEDGLSERTSGPNGYLQHESLYGVVKLGNGDLSDSCTSESHAYFELDPQPESPGTDVPWKKMNTKPYSGYDTNWYPTYSVNSNQHPSVALEIKGSYYKTV